MSTSETYCVYVLVGCSSGHRYVGMTTDPARRLSEHNQGHTQSTAAYGPYILVILKRYPNRQDARRGERYFKSGFGRKAIDRLLANIRSLPNETPNVIDADAFTPGAFATG